MNKKENIYIVGGIIIVAVAGYFAYKSGIFSSTNNSSNDDGGQVVCTMEAKQCPDGSYVGRTGPKCEFSPCPSSPTSTIPSPTSITLTASLNQKVAGLGVTLQPVSVIEDSRCPVGVQCVWAGTVKVKTVVGSGLGESTMTLELNKSITTEAEIITLILVSPNRSASQPPVLADYRFAFKVEKR